MAQLFANNAYGALAATLSDTATSLTLVAGQGARFPTPTGGDFFLATLIGLDSNGLESYWETVKVTGRATDALTIVRAQEGSTALIWPSGTRIELRATAGTFAGFLPLDGSKSLTGNLSFSGTGLRITGDFSNGTIANRLLVQTSTANASTVFGVIPSGTAVNAQIHVYGASDPTNAPLGTMTINSTSVRFQSSASGTGTVLPMTFWVGATEAARISTGSNLLIGTTTDNGTDKLQVNGSISATSFVGSGAALTGLTSGQITTALGFTPYNATNPSGYITSASLAGYLTSATAASTYLPLSGGTISGNLGFSGTGNRITGDFSNATIANRVGFQSSTANGSTAVPALPNGTSRAAAWRAFADADPTNSSFIDIFIDGSTPLTALRSDKTGTGSYMDMAFFTGGSERLRITSAGVLQDGNSLELGWKTIPQNSQSAAYTCVLSDSGKHILHPSADTTARTFTIPANSSVAYPIGTAITFVNQNGAGSVTIAITTDTMRLAGAGTTGSRTLAANGIATAVKITSTEWIISGSGLT